MKKISLFIAILLGTQFPLFSQMEKGTVLVGGNAGFQFKVSNQQASNLKTTEFIFSATPYALYSVIKQLALGGQLSYAFDQKKNSDPTNSLFQSTSAFSIGPAIRANIFIGGKTFFFLHTASSFGIDITRYSIDRNKEYYSNSIIAWRAGPGLSVFASKNMAIEFGIYYDGMKEVRAIKLNKSVVPGSDNTFFTHGLTLAIGLQFYTHKRPKAPANNQ